MLDSNKRSLAKAFSWRLIAIVLLTVISYIATGSVEITTSITLAYHAIQILIYFMHERVWSSVSWGVPQGLFIQMTGLSGSGKSTLAQAVKNRLSAKGYRVEVIDGDEYREGLCKDLGFSKEDRNTNIRRLGFVGNVLSRNKVIAIMAAINPYEEVRAELRKSAPNTKTVYVGCDIETLVERDPKGLYRKAMLPDGHPEKIEKFTGVSDPFDAPLVCDLSIDTSKEDIAESVAKLEKFILENIK